MMTAEKLEEVDALQGQYGKSESINLLTSICHTKTWWVFKPVYFAHFPHLPMICNEKQVNNFSKVSSIRTPMLIQGRLERTGTNLMYFKWGSVWITSFFKTAQAINCLVLRSDKDQLGLTTTDITQVENAVSEQESWQPCGTHTVGIHARISTMRAMQPTWLGCNAGCLYHQSWIQWRIH